LLVKSDILIISCFQTHHHTICYGLGFNGLDESSGEALVLMIRAGAEQLEMPRLELRAFPETGLVPSGITWNVLAVVGFKYMDDERPTYSDHHCFSSGVNLASSWFQPAARCSSLPRKSF